MGEGLNEKGNGFCKRLVAKGLHFSKKKSQPRRDNEGHCFGQKLGVEGRMGMGTRGEGELVLEKNLLEG